MRKTIITTLFLIAATIKLPAGSGICVGHPPPTDLTATAYGPKSGYPKGGVHLEWAPGDNSGVSFDILRSNDGGATFVRISFGYPKGHYNDAVGFKGLTSGETVCYKVAVGDDNPGTCESAASAMSTDAVVP